MIRLLSALLVMVAISVYVLKDHLPGEKAAPKSRRSALGRKVWPPAVTKVEIPCSDGALQNAMWYAPPTPGKKPLLVGLHTWSFNYAAAGGDAVYAEWCLQQGWAFLHPDFRGPNNTSQAMGSDRAIQDVVEAVAWAKKNTEVDESRIYLIGVSGGGHMAMLMAGRHPELWTAVSAWCGISDIGQWHAEHVKNGKPDNYAQSIEAALGRAPVAGDAEVWKRSPLSVLSNAASVPLDINHGIHDGRTGSVPFTHSLRAYNAVVPETEKLDADVFAELYQTQQLPQGWAKAAPDASYANRQPLFRHQSDKARITLFEGTHEIVHQAALNWLARQRKGETVVWEAPEFIPVSTADSESGK